MKPQDCAKQNINIFKKQLSMFGCTYDWDRSFSTADEDYFKRTQRIFLKLYNHYYDDVEKKALPIDKLKEKIENSEVIIPSSMDEETFLNNQRLAFVDYKAINWCPQCKTGLANEDLEE
jgi:leucyl-tRNA synthetase